jgi:hypothetical protein
MKMKPINLIGFSVLIFTIVACGQSSTQETQTEETTESSENWVVLDEADYSIQYPDTFDLDQSGQMGLDFVLFSRQASEQDYFKENLNLFIEDLAGQNVSLDDYKQLSLLQIEQLISNFELIESSKITIANTEAIRFIYTGKQGDFDLKWEQIVFVENEKAYILSLTCEVDQFDTYAPVGEEIMKSFKVK